MITSVKNVDYSFLFQEASDLIRAMDAKKLITLTEAEREYLDPTTGPGRFTSLEQYFTHLGDLVKYAHSTKLDESLRRSPIKFLMLPLDEPAFEVDANSRTITVPTDFKKFGVSVQGDAMAETLFFRMDRFFDYMDLLETNAYIQWELPDGTQGADVIPYIDYESEHAIGKMILVWPLTKRVTEQYGTLTFSLRFFKKDANGNVSYSWNSLPCAINIKQALKSEWDYAETEIEDATGIFTTIINNSTNVSNADPVDPPLFEAPAGYTFLGISNMNEPVYLYRNAGTIQAANGTTISVPANGLVLRAAAYIKDSGVMSYSWKRAPLGQDGGSHTLATGEVVFEEISADEYAKGPIAYKEYYVINNEVPGGYEKADFTTAKNADLQLYHRLAECKILPGDETITGTYILTAHHRFGFPTAEDSIQVVVPGPSDIAFTTDLDDSNDTGAFIDANGNAALSVVIDRETLPSNAWQGVTYDWRRSTTDKNSVVDSVFLDETYDAKTSTLTMTNAQPGWYQVGVTTMVNRDEKVIHSKVQRLTKMPEPPVLNYPYRDANGTLNIVAVEGRDEKGNPKEKLELVCEYQAFVNPDLTTDALKFEWLDDGVVIDKDFVHVDAYKGYNTNKLEINCKKLPENVAIRCRVTNILNGEESQPVETGTFSVLFDSTTTVS